MVEFKDALIFIPFALLYNMFFHKMTEMLYKNTNHAESFKKSIALLLAIGILSMVIGLLIIPEHPKYNDPNIRLGILIGGLLLILSVIGNNWGNMGDMGKLVAIGVIIGCIIGVTYVWIDTVKLQF